MSQASSTTEHGDFATDGLATRARETVDRIASKANRAGVDMRDTAAKTADGVKHVEEQALDTARDALHESHSLIEKNPLVAAGIAFAAGALLSMLIRR